MTMGMIWRSVFSYKIGSSTLSEREGLTSSSTEELHHDDYHQGVSNNCLYHHRSHARLLNSLPNRKIEKGALLVQMCI